MHAPRFEDCVALQPAIGTPEHAPAGKHASRSPGLPDARRRLAGSSADDCAELEQDAALEALTTGGPNLQVLRTLGERWARSSLKDSRRARDGLVLLCSTAGLRGSRLPAQIDGSPETTKAALAAIVREAQSQAPPRGSLASLPSASAKQVAARLCHFFAAAVALLATAAGLEGSQPGHSEGGAPALLGALVTWLAAAAAGTPVRALRLAASAAGFGALQALHYERCIACSAGAELEKQLAAHQAAAHRPDARQAGRVARLVRGCADARKVIDLLATHSKTLQDRLLKPRLRDAAPAIRSLALNCLVRLIHSDPDTFGTAGWPQRVVQAFCDPSAEVRLRAVQLASQFFSKRKSADDAAAPELCADQSCSPKVSDRGLWPLAAQLVPLLAERARDVDPKVAAASVRGLRQPCLAKLLSDADFAAVACLCFVAPETHLSCREEAVLLVDEHLLPAPGLGAAAKEEAARRKEASRSCRGPGAEEVSEAAANEAERRREQEEESNSSDHHFCAERGILALIDFLVNYLPNNQLQLSSRVVRALWGRAECLLRWATMADLCLVGEGAGAADGIPPLSGRQRLCLLHVLEAAVTCSVAAAEHDSKSAMWLQAAAAGLLPRLPRLFELLGSEQDCIALLALVAQQLLRYLCLQSKHSDEAPGNGIDAREMPLELPRGLLAVLLRLAGPREALHPPRVALQISDCLASMAARSPEAQSACQGLAAELCKGCESKLPRPHARVASGARQLFSSSDCELAASVGPLVALGSRGVDIWSCTQPQGSANHLLQGAIYLLEARSIAMGGPGGAASELQPTPGVLSVSSAAHLLDFMVLLLSWRARAGHLHASKQSDVARPAAEGKAGFLLACSLVRACCAKLLPAERNLVLRFHAFSAYMTVLQLEIGAAVLPADADATSWPRVSAEHAEALDAALGFFFDRCPALAPSRDKQVASSDGVSEAGWRVKMFGNRQPMTAVDQPLTASRWLLEQQLSWPTPDAEGSEVIAVASARMVAECEHEAVFTGPVAQRLLRQLAGGGPTLADLTAPGALAQVRSAASTLARRLRRLGGRSHAEATRGFSVQFGACTQHAEQLGIQAGLRLAEALILEAQPPSAPGSRAAIRLGKGLAAALKSHGLEALQIQGASRHAKLEVLAPWLRDAACPLPAGSAKQLAGTLAAASGLLTPACKKVKKPGRAIASQGSTQDLQSVPGAWALVHALQVRGSACLKRSMSWKVKVQDQARRRRMRSSRQSLAAGGAGAGGCLLSGGAGPAGSTGWLPRRHCPELEAAAPAEPTGRSEGLKEAACSRKGLAESAGRLSRRPRLEHEVAAPDDSSAQSKGSKEGAPPGKGRQPKPRSEPARKRAIGAREAVPAKALPPPPEKRRRQEEPQSDKAAEPAAPAAPKRQWRLRAGAALAE